MHIFGKLIIITILSMLSSKVTVIAATLNPAISILLLEHEAVHYEVECNDDLDTDGDRISDCFETNTGIYKNRKNTGTDPLNADTDGDGITDGDEILGTQAGLRLHVMGANPLRKNIFIEYDWFNDFNECGFHSHKPTAEIIDKIALAFLQAPVTNPDGSTGIDIIQDYGQGGGLFGGNRVVDSNGVLGGGIISNEFIAHKNANFASNRIGYFHYMLFTHRYNNNSDSSGQAELPGDDSIVSLYCFYNNSNFVANTIMHELGHNLNLRHGGNHNCNYKPNYNSIMNYRFQFTGIDQNTSCDARGDGLLSYSKGDRITLREIKLNEFKGVCETQPVDWDASGHFSTPVNVDINSEDPFQVKRCGGFLTALKDHNDWDNIVFLNSTSKARLAFFIREIISETSIPK